MQCSIPLSRAEGPLYGQVYVGLRRAILEGVYQSGERLPSTRELAEQLGISRTVVLVAYEQLLAEGFAHGRRGSGTYVSGGLRRIRDVSPRPSEPLRLTRFGSCAAASWSEVNVPPRQAPSLPYDFAYGRSDLQSFPLAMWRRILSRCARKASVSELNYGAATGNPDLQEAICSHLRRSRAVVCDPSQIIVVSGSQQALDLISRVLVKPGDATAVEDPSYQGTVAVLRGAAARLLPIPVDRDGLDPTLILEAPLSPSSLRRISFRPVLRCRWAAGSRSCSGREAEMDSSSRMTTTASFGTEASYWNRYRGWIVAHARSTSARSRARSIPLCVLGI